MREKTRGGDNSLVSRREGRGPAGVVILNLVTTTTAHLRVVDLLTTEHFVPRSLHAPGLSLGGEDTKA